MASNGKSRPHPLLGLVDDEPAAVRPSARRTREGSLVGKVWDDERGAPVEPPQPLPPVDISSLAEEQEPGLRTLARKVAAAALRRLAKAIDTDD